MGRKNQFENLYGLGRGALLNRFVDHPGAQLRVIAGAAPRLVVTKVAKHHLVGEMTSEFFCGEGTFYFSIGLSGLFLILQVLL